MAHKARLTKGNSYQAIGATGELTTEAVCSWKNVYVSNLQAPII